MHVLNASEAHLILRLNSVLETAKHWIALFIQSGRGKILEMAMSRYD